MKKIIIGTRKSSLALWQADFVAQALMAAHPGLVAEKRLMSTKGDKILDAPLAKIGGKGLFTKELEEEMLAGGIDIAVHSLKDMPTALPEGLKIAAITKRADPGDAFVSNLYESFEALPQGARVGTSSLRRKAQLLAVRPDLKILDLRGNVNTRLKKLDAGEYDAAVLACAGLKRLGFGERIREVFKKEMLLPAVGQGALAIEAREGDEKIMELVAPLHDEATAACARAERAFLGRVEGGCQVPVGVYAVSAGLGLVRVRAVIASLDGARIYRGELAGEPEETGIKLAETLLAAGGREILAELGLSV